jgi:hypothetical protein
MIREIGALFCAAALVVPGVTPRLQAALPEAPIHHAADVRIDPESRHLTVVDVITVRGRKEIHFRLASWLKVDGLLLDGRAVPVPAEAEVWRATLPDDLPHRIEVHMQGTLPLLQPGRGPGLEQPAALGPEGGYLLEGAGWIPVTGDDLVSYDLRVEVPVPYRAVATGRLGDEDVSGTAYSATFAARYPAAPPALFVGPYEVREHQEGNIRIRTYFHHNLADLGAVYLSDSARYLMRYQARIGPYPYRDFHVISAPVPVGLGFPGLTYIGRRVLRLPFIRARSLAHEVLHNWWGNAIAVDYRNGNWAEGLTTYMADYALAAEEDAEEARQMRGAWLGDYAALPAERDVPVTRFTARHDEAARVIGYNKVAFIFHMLEHEIGEADFAAALRLFWQRHQFRIAGWMDLRQAFEEASGRDLAQFFEQWLTRAGAPRLHLGHVGVETRTDPNAYRLRFTLRQEQPEYRLTIPVVIETRGARRRDWIVLEGAETTVTLDLNAQPLALHLDPAHDLFRRLLPGEAPPILRDVTLATDAVTVIAASDQAMSRVARQLAERLLDTPVRLTSDASAPFEAAPLLIIGATQEVEAILTRRGLGSIPDNLVGRGTSRVWTGSQSDNRPLLVVAADGIQALQALLQPLPHYGSKSYLVFDGRRAIENGIWPVTSSPLSRRLD